MLMSCQDRKSNIKLMYYISFTLTCLFFLRLHLLDLFVLLFLLEHFYFPRSVVGVSDVVVLVNVRRGGRARHRLLLGLLPRSLGLLVRLLLLLGALVRLGLGLSALTAPLLATVLKIWIKR